MILLNQFRPKPTLVVKNTNIQQPRFPVIDAHNHLGSVVGLDYDQRPVGECLDALDAANVRLYIDLDGGFSKETLYAHLDHFKNAAPDRFKIFGGVDWNRFPEYGDRFGEWAAAELREQSRQGAEGLKVWKILGLQVRDQHDRLVSVDDPRLIPLWETAGELGIPVTIHVADPVSFFDPVDETNERLEELSEHPDWAFTSPPYPSFLSIVEAFSRVVERHSRTRFIGAHVGCYAEDLDWVGNLLDRCPNFFVDISARAAELGRKPYSSRRFFLQYADRILFGSDFGPDPESYRIYYRFLETDDEYIRYNVGEDPWQGRWRICGLFLPEEVLKKVYFDNAARIFLPSTADHSAKEEGR